MYAPKDAPCMELVPPIFAARAYQVWTTLGSPPVSFQSFWTVYRGLMQGLRNLPYDEEFAAILMARTNTAPRYVVDGEELEAAAELEVDLALYQELPAGERRMNPANLDVSGATFFEYVGGVSQPNLPSHLRNHVPLPIVEEEEDEEEYAEMDEIVLTEDEDVDNNLDNN